MTRGVAAEKPRARIRDRARAARQSPYLAGVAKLATGTALAQVIGLASAPVITRLYAPAEYGAAASLAALVAIASGVAALRYDFAVVLPEDDGSAARVVGLCWMLAAATTLLVGVAAIGSAAWGWAGTHPAAPALGWLPLAVAVSAAAMVVTAWANRKREYGILARSRIAASALQPAVSIAAFAWVGSTVHGLVAALVAGAAASSGVALVMLRRAGSAVPGWSAARGGRWREVASRYRQFPRFSLPMSLLEQVTASLPVLAFAGLFGPATAAWFALANNMVRLPVGLVNQAVGQVFYERAARARDDAGELRRLLASTLAGLAGPALLLAAGGVVLGPLAFRLVFGAAYGPSGEYAQMLAIAAAAGLLTSPISMLPAVLDRQGAHLAISFAVYAARTGAVLAGAALHSPLMAVALFAAAETAAALGFVAWLWLHVSALARRAADAAP